jgi:thymidylate kinase
MKKGLLPYENNLQKSLDHPFYVIEGIDGSGKSSVGLQVANRVKGAFFEQPECFRLAQPPIDQEADIKARFLFYLGYNIQASEEIARLVQQSPVIGVRYLYTTIVYHIAKGLPADWVWKLAKQLPLYRPTKVFFLDVSDSAVQKERIRKRGVTDEDKRTFDIMNRIRSLYLDIQQVMPGFTYIDTSCLTMEQVIHQITNEIKI